VARDLVNPLLFLLHRPKKGYRFWKNKGFCAAWAFPEFLLQLRHLLMSISLLHLRGIIIAFERGIPQSMHATMRGGGGI
jgi:hypothetical protein